MIKISIKFFIFVLLIFHFLIADERSEVKLYIFEDIAYIALEEFFISQDFQYNLYKDKSKIDVIIENKRFTFSTNSSFVKIDDKIYHMIKNIKFFDNNFYAPLNSFMRLYTQFDNKEFIVNYNDKVIIIKDERYIFV